MSIREMLIGACRRVTGNRWIATLDYPSKADTVGGVCADPSGNLIIYGTTGSAGAATPSFMAKYNSSGAVQWQKMLDSGGTENGQAAATDSSGNVYMCGGTSVASDALLLKRNSSGALQWQKCAGVGSNLDLFYDVAVDTSGIYVAGVTNNGTATSVPVVAKYDSSGAIQWQRKMDVGQYRNIGLDGSSNVYVVGTVTSTINYGIVAKYNSSGALQWQRKLSETDSGKHTTLTYVTVTSGGVYILGATNNGNNNDIVLNKYDASGSYQWTRVLASDTPLAGSDGAGFLCADSAGDLYVAITLPSITAQSAIVKYSAAGVLQWTRNLRCTNAFTILGLVELSGVLYAAAQSNLVSGSANQFATLLKLSNPPRNGIYGSWTVANNQTFLDGGLAPPNDIVLTDSAGALVDSAGAMSAVTPTYTDGNAGMTAALLLTE